MRPHVELISEDDLIWHDAELPGSSGVAVQRHLSYDEETGAASTKVHFRTRWSRPGGYYAADTEWFVLTGRVVIGGRTLHERGYFRAPAGLRVEDMEADEDTEVLLFREYGDDAFSVSERNRFGFMRRGAHDVSGEPGEVTVVDSEGLSWETPQWEEPNEPSGLQVKILYRDPSPPDAPANGFIACLQRAPVGWRADGMFHLAVFEEAYGLSGAVAYNFGVLAPGNYYHRPPLVKHGGLAQTGTEPAEAFVRRGGDAPRWVTRDPYHRVIAVPVNYVADDPLQALLPAGIAVRSATAGPEPLPSPTPAPGEAPAAASATLSNRLQAPTGRGA